MQARYYDPVIGRFYSNDPVGWTPENPVMSFNRYLYVNNNPYKYTDPNGEYLLGINLGVSGTFENTNVSLSLSFAVDDNGKAQVTLTPEIGVSNKKLNAGAFARVMVGGENTTVDHLDGAGLSASGSNGMVSTSITAPGVAADGTGLVPEGIVQSFDASNSIVEFGIGTPTVGTEVTGTVTSSISRDTTALGDLGRSIGSAVHGLVNEER